MVTHTFNLRTWEVEVGEIHVSLCYLKHGFQTSNIGYFLDASHDVIGN